MMKKYNIFRYAVYILALIATLSSCRKQEESILLGSDNSMHFSCAEETADFTICASGVWTVNSDASWLSFSKKEGKGDGNTREKIVVTASHNTGRERTATFSVNAGGKTLVVNCEQEEGHPLKFGQLKLSAALEVGIDTKGITLNLPYEYGYKGMKLNLKVDFSGEASKALSVKDNNITIEKTQGVIKLPLCGTPELSGKIIIKIDAGKADIIPSILETKVNERILLEQHFDNCIYGGDFVANKQGTRPKWVQDNEGKDVLPNPIGELINVKPGDDGSKDLFKTMAKSYLGLKGMGGWSGSKVYERPGYIKIGTGKAVGKIITPAFTLLKKSKNIDVSLKVAEWGTEENGKLIISLEGSGTPSINEYVYKHKKTQKGSEWENVRFTIKEAFSDTRIVFTTKGNKRFAIDDVVVSEK